MEDANDYDMYGRQFYLDDNYIGSKRLEAYRKRVERNRKNQARPARRLSAGREYYVSNHLEQIDHFFHPSCPLFHRQNRRFRCGACHRYFHDQSYRCETCDFDMDVKCAQVVPVEEGTVAHFIHRHPLLVLAGHHKKNQLGVNQYSSICQICSELCRVSDTSPVCACKDCQFYVHKSCMDVLPREVQQHFFHECASPLVFVTRLWKRCDACNERRSGLCYFCRECGYSMCVECSLLNIVSSLKSEDGTRQKIQHFLHKHTLDLVEKPQAGTTCNACGNQALLDITYFCQKCSFFLHRSCSELPHGLRSFSHLHHPLFLKNLADCHLESHNSICILCLKDCQEYFAYCCEKCNIILDVECAFHRPTIEYQRHNHLLTVVDSLHADEFKCFACSKYHGGFPVFRCVECNFNLHLICGPLPVEIKHRCHIHPLKLLDYLVEENRHDHCCHACELPRDPELCVYYCSDCPFVADVKCILSQILLSLRGIHGEVELRTVARRIPSRLVIDSTMNQLGKDRLLADAKEDMIMRRTQSSNNILKYFNMQEVSECSINYVNGSLICNLKFRGKTSLRVQEASFSYSDECFVQLLKRLKLNSLIWDTQLQNFVEEHNRFVTLGEYLFPETLIPIFTTFLEKHGDPGINSKAKGHNIKSVYFYLLCCVLESMNTTKLLDITEDQLTNWHACLFKVKKAGFKIQVIYDHLELVVRAHFGLRARSFRDGTSNQLEGKIKSISKEIERLTKELEESKRSLDKHEKFVEKETTSLIKQCIKDASKNEIHLRSQWLYMI